MGGAWTGHGLPPPWRGAALLSGIFALLVLCVSLLVLVAWWSDARPVWGLLLSQPPMVALTAEGILLLAVSLALGSRGGPHTGSRVCAVGAAMVGLGGLLQQAPGWPWRFDDLAQRALVAPLPPGAEMAAASALAILLAAVGLLLLDARRRVLRVVAALCSAACVVLSLTGVLNHLYGSGVFQRSGLFMPMSRLTALCLLAISAGTLLSRPGRGWMGAALAKGEGGVLAARLLPVVLLAPPLLGWMHLDAVRSGLVDAGTATAALVVVLMLGLAGLTLWAAQAVQARADAQRAMAQALQRMNATLEAQVAAAVHQRLQAEGALMHAQKLEALGQLAGGVAHDFNNAAAVVLAGLQLLERRHGREVVALGPDAQRLLRGMREGAERGAAVARRLLAFARRGKLEPDDIEVGALLADLAEVLSPTLGAGVRVRTAAPPGTIHLRADKAGLETMLVNLAVNARDAMPRGGEVVLGAAAERVAPGHAAGLVPGDYVRLWVADEGEGMDAETLARATEPFFTTKPSGKGTGLGLSMAHGFALQSGGALHIETAPGRGTRVTAWLPLAA